MALAQQRAFNVPEAEAVTSIPELARQGDIQIIAPADQLKGIRTPAIKGEMDVREALKQLIRNTGLKIVSDSDGVIVLQMPQEQSYLGGPIEEVVVTGSRLKRSTFDSPTPVMEADRETIQEEGYVDLGDALSDIPGVDQSINLSTSQEDTQNNGLSVISLRGLGSNRTLTLIDGHRTVSNSGNRNAVSLSSLPKYFVDRVEITTGGASAVYGADAVAGVVNIITEDKLDGFEARVTGGGTKDGGGDNDNFSFGAGQHFFDNRLYVMAGLDYSRQMILRARDRNWAMRSLEYDPDTNTVTTPDTSSYMAGGYFNSGAYYYDESGLQTNYTSADGYEDRKDGTLITPADNLSAAVKLRYDLTEDTQLWSQLLFSQVKTNSVREPYFMSYSSEYGVDDEYEVGRISLDNPYVPSEIASSSSSSGVTWRRRMVEVGNLEIYNRRNTLRGWLGLKGTVFNDWDWDLTYGYGAYSGFQVRRNGINEQRMAYALDSENTGDGTIECADADAREDGCVPINIFGVGSISDAAADYVRANVWYRPHNRQDDIQGTMSGTLFDLPAGPVESAFGFELHRDLTRTRVDPLTTAGLTNFAYIPEYSGDIEAKEVFAEASFPLLKDLPFAHELTFDVAGRFGHYNLRNVNNVFSGRLGLQWAPIQDIRFRSEYSTAQRAPNTTELYSPPRDDYDTIVDPCSGVTQTSTGRYDDNCRMDPGIAAALEDSTTFTQASSEVNAPNSGNADLHEETAHTLTAGVVVTPRFAKDLQLSVDYYDIRIAGAIDTLSNTDLLAECYGDPNGIDNAFCAEVTRDSEGQITKIVNEDQNLDEERASGIDAALAYGFRLTSLSIPGKFKISFSYSHRIDLNETYQGAVTQETDNYNGEVGSSKNRARTKLRWSKGPVSLSWAAVYYGAAVDSNTLGAYYRSAGITNPLYYHFSSYWRHDVMGSYSFGRDRTFRVFGVVNNVFNQYGPFIPYGTDSGNKYNYNATYGVRGLSYQLGLEAKF
ncbi:TonB-dependent receptor [Solimonas sp. C16B3]|uniref:TonB-dependent receptor n=1 Tax=Solimonas marina TaxID=2714601 RepID=A0A970B332_9GAMM|nr:TonB-dependent receptor [Solimonas marina]